MVLYYDRSYNFYLLLDKDHFSCFVYRFEKSKFKVSICNLTTFLDNDENFPLIL
jgi:hypothetical protein